MRTSFSSRNFDVVMVMDAILISLACLLVILAYREINDAPKRHARDLAGAVLAVADDLSTDRGEFVLRTDGDGSIDVFRRLEQARETVREISPEADLSIYSPHPAFERHSVPADAFRAAAYEHFNSGGDTPVELMSGSGAGGLLLTAVPLRALRDCARCEALGYQGFSKGDLIGIRELRLPVGDTQAQTMRKLLYACGLMASSLMVFIGFIIPMLKRHRHEKAQISDRADTFEKQATTDPLTGLYNRRYFEQALDAFLTEFNDKNAPLGLLIFDLDHFKQVNDTHGHDAGDMVLQEVALRLRAITRDNDVVARIGGEEFAVITPFANREQLLGVAERYRTAISALKIDIGKVILRPTISIGVATNSEGVLHAADMFKQADAKLYEAKRNGRNRVAA